MNRIAYSSIFLIALLFTTNAQDTIQEISPKLQLSTKHYGDHIVLRWAPMDAEWWYYGINSGYKVERREVSDPNSRYTVIIDTILPWTEDKMQNWFVSNPEDEVIIIPLQTIHRDWENTRYSVNDFNDIHERSELFNQRYHTTILAADIYSIVAEAAGLKFIDKNIDPEKVYSYKVTYNHGGHYDAYSVVRQWQIIDRPSLHEATEKENAITLSWDKKLHQGSYTAYYIERSPDGKNFERLNKHPFVHAVGDKIESQQYNLFTDPVTNYDLYYYRIIGIDPFGDESLPSDPVLATGRDRTPPFVKPLSVNMSEAGDFNQIKWSHDPIEEIQSAIIYKNDPDQKAKIIYRSEKASKFSFQIEDKEVVDGMSDYFLVLVDTAGNYAQSTKSSLYRKDNVPPKAPLNLKASADTSGTIVLTWDQGPDNDIIGYYLYTADRKYDNYIKLNQKKHPFRIYEDSVNMELLTDKRFYKIAAIDKGGNIGAYSEILEVNRPDKIPPSPSLFYDYRVDSSGIFLGLVPSSSHDVVAHRLYRKLQEETTWKLIQSFDNKPPQIFWDKNTESDTPYSYKWVAVDEANLESSPEQSTIHLTSYDIRTAFIPQMRLEQTDNGVKVEFAKNIPGRDYRIQIVRSLNNGKYKTLSILTQGNEYLDKINLDKDQKNEVVYRAKVLYKDGKRSKFSAETKL